MPHTIARVKHMVKFDGWRRMVEEKLDELAQQKRLMTYLEMAEYAGIPSPYRIQQLTEFLEELIAHDASAGRAIRAAFVVSKTNGIPADGFFECLVTKGIVARPGESRIEFHQRLLEG